MNKFLALMMCICFLVACGGGKEEKRDNIALSRLKAAELSEQAAEAYKKGAYELALKYYREALRLSRSFEDFKSMAVGAINTASALRAVGQFDASEDLMDELLGAHYMDLTHEIEAEARYLKAIIMLDKGDSPGAVKQADMSLEACRKGCDALPRIYNLLARAYMAAGDHKAVRDKAQAGLKASRSNEDQREEANALRILARLDEEDERYENASERFEQALEIDKKLALGAKIYYDLMGRGRVAAKMGNADKSTEYFMRAQKVAEALGDELKVNEAKKGLEATNKDQ